MAEACAAWERLKQEQSGLHLLGTATVTERSSSPGRAAYELEVSSYRFRVELVRQMKWAVFTDLDNAPEISDWATSMSEFVKHWPGADGEMIEIALPDPAEYGPIVNLEDVTRISLGPQWKVDRFEPIEDTG